jgi:hypothetical protein
MCSAWSTMAEPYSKYTSQPHLQTRSAYVHEAAHTKQCRTTYLVAAQQSVSVNTLKPASYAARMVDSTQQLV